MHRVKGVIEPFILLAPLAVVGEGGGKTKHGVELFYNGQIAQCRAVKGLFMEDIKQIGDDNGVVVVVQTEKHGDGAHHGHDEDGGSVPQGLGFFHEPALHFVHDPNGDKGQGQGEHYIVPVLIEKFPGGKEIEGHFRQNTEDQ